MNSDSVILLAEDDANDALLFKLAMKQAGITNSVEHVRNGEEAINYLTKANENGPDVLVITDLKMHCASGFDLLQWMQKEDLGKKFRVIVLSGSARGQDIERALDLGAQDYWIKPSSVEELASLLNKLMERGT